MNSPDLPSTEPKASVKMLPTLREFSRQFKRKYGRVMTQQERQFFHLLADIIENPPPAIPRKTTRNSND